MCRGSRGCRPWCQTRDAEYALERVPRSSPSGVQRGETGESPGESGKEKMALRKLRFGTHAAWPQVPPGIFRSKHTVFTLSGGAFLFVFKISSLSGLCIGTWLGGSRMCCPTKAGRCSTRRTKQSGHSAVMYIWASSINIDIRTRATRYQPAPMTVSPMNITI